MAKRDGEKHREREERERPAAMQKMSKDIKLKNVLVNILTSKEWIFTYGSQSESRPYHANFGEFV